MINLSFDKMYTELQEGCMAKRRNKTIYLKFTEMIRQSSLLLLCTPEYNTVTARTSLIILWLTPSLGGFLCCTSIKKKCTCYSTPVKTVKTVHILNTLFRLFTTVMQNGGAGNAKTQFASTRRLRRGLLTRRGGAGC